MTSSINKTLAANVLDDASHDVSHDVSGVAWITGASSGIGAEIALQLAARGWRVAVSARNAKALQHMAAQNANIFSYPLDVTRRRATQSVVTAIEADLGPIDWAILNAGIYLPTDLPHFDAKLFDQSFAVNVGGAVNGLNAVLPSMTRRRQGRLALMASVAGYNGLPTSSAYGATKAAILNMAEALAIELRPIGIGVSVIAPGFVETPATDRNQFAMPFILPVDEAARRIITGLEKGQFLISFPRRFAAILRALSFLPRGFYVRLMAAASRKRSS